LPGGIVGTSYSANLTAQGGAPPYEWSIQSGNLPPGLVLITATGAIIGVPILGRGFSFDIDVQVRDNSGQLALQPLTITIAGGVPTGTVAISPEGGRAVRVDGTSNLAPWTFTSTPGGAHTIAVASP
jgi:hypothetical protein